MAMNPLSKTKTAAKAADGQSSSPEGAGTGRQTVSLITHLEEANNRLRQQIVELSLETAALRQELERSRKQPD